MTIWTFLTRAVGSFRTGIGSAYLHKSFLSNQKNKFTNSNHIRYYHRVHCGCEHDTDPFHTKMKLNKEEFNRKKAHCIISLGHQSKL